MKATTIIVSLVLVLAACADINTTPKGARYASLSTTSLWIEYARAESALDLAFIEAELGLRGERQYAGSYLGQRTSAAYQRDLYTRTTPASLQNDRNCSDFASAAAAQKFFLQSGGPISDPNNLDADGDGLACEWGVQINRTAKQIQASQRAEGARIAYRARCYRGPRGGTYTITASGRRNYDGC